MIDRQENNLNQYQLQNSPIISLTQKGRKLQALKEKIITDKFTHYNNAFTRYVQQIQKSIQQKNNESEVNMKKQSLSKQKVKRNKRMVKQLQLPFEMYIYSSSSGQSQERSQNNESPFRVQGSSSSSQQQRQQSAQRQHHHKQRQKNQNNRIFSFAKINNRKIHLVDRNVLDELNMSNKLQEVQMLQKLLDQKRVKQMVEKYARVCMGEIDDDIGSKDKQYNIERRLQRLVIQQLTDILSVHFMNMHSQLTDQITNQYLSKIFIPLQEQKLQEIIYLRKQQLQIKTNQLATLQSIHKEMSNNQHIQRLIQVNKFKPNKRELEQQQQQFQINVMGQNIVNSKDKHKISKNNNNRQKVPSLVLNSIININKTKNIKQQQQGRYKPLTQRVQNYQSLITDRSLNPPKSKPGRTYQYQNENQNIDLSVKSSTSKFKQQQQVNRQRSKGKDNDMISRAREQSSTQLNNQRQRQLRDKRANQLQGTSFNQLLQQFKQQQNNKYHQDKYNNSNNNPQSTIVQLKRLQLQHEYKQNIQAVTQFQIQYLKTQLDKVKQQLTQLLIQYDNKYKSIQLNNRLQYLHNKEEKIKKKLKQKIKLFWKHAHTNITQSVQ